eukprot:SAG31_NODE_3714_length_3957_cov_3.388025_1_plen_53_part_00
MYGLLGLYFLTMFIYKNIFFRVLENLVVPEVPQKLTAHRRSARSSEGAALFN